MNSLLKKVHLYCQFSSHILFLLLSLIFDISVLHCQILILLELLCQFFVSMPFFSSLFLVISVSSLFLLLIHPDLDMLNLFLFFPSLSVECVNMVTSWLILNCIKDKFTKFTLYFLTLFFHSSLFSFFMHYLGCPHPFEVYA